MRRMSSLQFLEILRKTLNKVDPRLVNHGEKVGYMVFVILNSVGKYNQDQIIQITLLAILHDIGAYKTEEIDDMMEFENNHVWFHSIYGYLFMKNLSIMKDDALPLLYHHLSYSAYKEVGLEEDDIAGLIRLADRIDVNLGYNDPEGCKAWIKENRGTVLSPYWVDLFLTMPNHDELLNQLYDSSYHQYARKMAENVRLGHRLIENYLTVIAYAIDFRSEFMILHTVTTVNVSLAIGKRMGLNPEDMSNLYYGSLLHDVGKIACPISILEKPGKLTDDEMEIMKEHVVETRNILEGSIHDDITEIASRHHERVDGSGYPRHLKLADLTLPQCICAVADIVSALVRQRSYKDAYDKEKTLTILKDMNSKGLLNRDVVQEVVDNFDEIMKETESDGQEVMDAYKAIQNEYKYLIDKYKDLDI
ncbi:HD domain-containing phosphohydrolase [Anaerorhabdus sp.]|uniref:HD domain-containing phosphohydrolase n=1 Tax=Anaerorhabdus sp. TaxID=1872524 RepID=UPI002FC87653